MKHTSQASKTKSAPIFIQMSIYTAILLISQLISELLPKTLPIPPTVIGLILMYVLLCSRMIKIEWVDSLGTLLISMIGFMFVPSGISLAANLDILRAEGLKLVLVIGLSTVLMLVIITYIASFILSLKKWNWNHLWLRLSDTSLFKKRIEKAGGK